MVVISRDVLEEISKAINKKNASFKNLIISTIPKIKERLKIPISRNVNVEEIIKT